MSDFQDYYESGVARDQPREFDFGAQMPPEQPEGGRQTTYIADVALAAPAKRLTACAVDFVAIFLLPLVVLKDVLPAGMPIVLCLLVFVVNYYAGSLGKRLVGIRAVFPVQNAGGIVFARIGLLRTFARTMLHWIDLFFFVGFLWAFKRKGYNRTWADGWTHIFHVAAADLPDGPLPKRPKHSVPTAW